MTEAELVHFDESLPAWERAFYAFLAEKERRSGSKRTVDAYSRTLQRFFGTLGKPPDQVTSQDVFVFAHGRGPSGRSSSPPIRRSPLEEPIHSLTGQLILYRRQSRMSFCHPISEERSSHPASSGAFFV